MTTIVHEPLVEVSIITDYVSDGVVPMCLLFKKDDYGPENVVEFELRAEELERLEEAVREAREALAAATSPPAEGYLP